MTTLLRLDNVTTYYGEIRILEGSQPAPRLAPRGPGEVAPSTDGQD